MTNSKPKGQDKEIKKIERLPVLENPVIVEPMAGDLLKVMQKVNQIIEWINNHET